MKTRTEITFEVDRWMVLSRSNKMAWCFTCSRYVALTQKSSLILTGL